MFYKKLYIVIFFIFFIQNLSANSFKEDHKIKEIFERNNIIGTIVVYDKNNDIFIGYNSKRANIEYSPASTFKIPNSIIAISQGVVSNVDEIFFKYEGQETFLNSWKKDSSLRDAIKVSNFLAYQQLSRKVGKDNMITNLKKMNYGNSKVGNKIDEFWVDNSLKISAIQQAKFLYKLASLELPYSKKVQKEVADIIKFSKGKEWVIYGKTGWYVPDGKLNTLGWFVGWVVNKNKIYAFAMNMDIKKNNSKDFPEDKLKQRQTITIEILKQMGIID